MDMFFSDGLFGLFFILVALGGCAGFLAGLLGIGGGLVLVPGLYFVFSSLGMVSENLMHVCVGTSLATVLFTGSSSARAHLIRASVDFGLVRSIGTGVLIGSMLASAFAASVSGYTLKIIFVAALVPMALILAFDLGRSSGVSARFGSWFYRIGGVFSGCLCTLMGIGGGAINVPFITLTGVPIHRAVGTAAALGVVVAVPAIIGFVFIGWSVVDRPPFSLGYVNVLAMLAILPTSVLCAPLGAALAHRLPVKRLRLFFAAFLIVVALKMGWGLMG